MKFWEAMKALEEGKTIKQKCVSKGWISLPFNKTMIKKEFVLSANIFECEWELCEEKSEVLRFGYKADGK